MAIPHPGPSSRRDSGFLPRRASCHGRHCGCRCMGSSMGASRRRARTLPGSRLRLRDLVRTSALQCCGCDRRRCSDPCLLGGLGLLVRYGWRDRSLPSALNGVMLIGVGGLAASVGTYQMPLELGLPPLTHSHPEFTAAGALLILSAAATRLWRASHARSSSAFSVRPVSGSPSRPSSCAAGTARQYGLPPGHRLNSRH
jgi:hypothetical protein